MSFGYDPPTSDGLQRTSPTYDRAHLDGVCNGNEELRRRILTEYVKTSQALMSQLDGDLGRGDLEGIRRVSHSLKGSSRTVGAFALADLCESLEHESLHSAQSVSAAAREEFQRVMDAIENDLGSAR